MGQPTDDQAVENERSAALARVQALETEFEALAGDSVDANADDEHDPEGSTLAYERARVAALLDKARANLDDVDRALARLAVGRYSVCEECGTQISAERLAALPAVRICLACATAAPPGWANGHVHLP
jgi:DnaK suppressor protein